MNKFSSALLLAALPVLLAGCDSLPSWMGGDPVEKPKLAGERIAVLPVTSEMQPDSTLKGVNFVVPVAVPNDNWTQHSGNFNAETGNLAAAGHFDSIIHATAGRGEAFQSTLVPTPVVGGSLVFLMDQVGNISAHEAANIQNVRWQYKGAVEEDEPALVGGGLAYDQGKLYLVSGRGLVAAVDAQTGKELWHKALHLPFRSAPKIADGKIFAITIDNQTYALSAEDGSVVWNHRGISETAGLMNAVSPTVEGKLVVVPYSSGEVYVLAAADGHEVWSESLSAGKRTKASALFVGIGGDPVIDGGVVFSVSSGGLTNVQALSNGQHVWDRPIGAMNTPWMAGDSMFILTSENVLLSVVKYDGRIRWSTPLVTYGDIERKKEPITWKGPVMVDGKLAVVGSNGQLLLVSSEDGKILVTQPIPEDIYTAPVVAGGRMYLVGQDATLYSLK